MENLWVNPTFSIYTCDIFINCYSLNFFLIYHNQNSTDILQLDINRDSPW